MSTQGERLKEIRQALKLSQQEFGDKLCVSKQYFSNLENDRNTLNNEKLVSLLVDFNVNLNYLLGGVGEIFLSKQKEDALLKKEILSEVENLLKSKGIL